MSLVLSFRGLKGAVVDGDLDGRFRVGILEAERGFLVVLEIRLVTVFAVSHVAFDLALWIGLLRVENDVAVTAFVVDPVAFGKFVDFLQGFKFCMMGGRKPT